MSKDMPIVSFAEAAMLQHISFSVQAGRKVEQEWIDCLGKVAKKIAKKVLKEANDDNNNGR
jgi:hypothetical protein